MEKLMLGFINLILLASTATATKSPYAPTTAGTTLNGSQIGSYTYDSGSNRLFNARGQIISMNLITKPETITSEFGAEIIRYGVGGKRYMRVHADGRKTFYINGSEYRIDGDTVSAIAQVHVTGYSPAAQVDFSDSNDPQYSYFVKDHLGSSLCWVGDDGIVHNRTRYEPWGQTTQADGVADDPRKAANPGQAIKAAELTRSFTGHERIAPVNLIHMNGRVYDPEIGMFMGPDLFIQGRSIPAMNRFIYGHNNAPNVVDWSGWIRFHFDPAIEPLLDRFARAASNDGENNFRNFSNSHLNSHGDFSAGSRIDIRRERLRRFHRSRIGRALPIYDDYLTLQLGYGNETEELPRIRVSQIDNGSYTRRRSLQIHNQTETMRVRHFPQGEFLGRTMVLDGHGRPMDIEVRGFPPQNILSGLVQAQPMPEPSPPVTAHATLDPHGAINNSLPQATRVPSRPPIDQAQATVLPENR